MLIDIEKNPQNSVFRFGSNRLRNEHLEPASRPVIYFLIQGIIPNISGIPPVYFFYENLNIKRIFKHTGSLLFFRMLPIFCYLLLNI